MGIAKTILKNTVSLLVSGIVAQLLIFCSIVYLARVLGPEDFGKINFATAIVIYFTMIVNMGLPLLGTREVARNVKRVKEYVSNIICIRLALFALCYTVLTGLAFLWNLPTDIRSIILIYGIGLLPSAVLLDWAYQGLEKMEYIGLSRILSGIVYLILVYALIKGPEQLLLIPAAHVASLMVSAVLLFLIFSNRFGWQLSKTNLTQCKTLFKKAFPIGLSILLVQVFYYIDSVMLGMMRSYEEVGFYNAANKIAFLVIMLGAAYFDAIFPVLSKYFKESKEAFINLNLKTAKLAVTIGIPLAVGGTLLAKPLMLFVYGAKYHGSVGAFRILIWFACINFINMIYSRGLWACDRQNIFLGIVSVQAASNVILNLFLIPPFGIYGAAVATVLVELLGLYLAYTQINKIASIRFTKFMLKPIGACFIMVAWIYIAQYFLSAMLVFLIISGSLVYFLILACFGGISNEEYQFIRQIIRK